MLAAPHLIVVFSDLHGHLARLEELLRRESGHRAFCAGDVLGSGGGNLGCLQLLRQADVPCVAGNHETDLWPVYLIHLPAELHTWVNSWPWWLDREDFRVVHSLLEPSRCGYAYRRVNRPEEARLVMQGHAARLVFMGHRHLPGWWEIGDESATWTSSFGEETLTLREGFRYAVDVGSLGEPLPPQAPCYVRYDGRQVRFARLAFSE